MYTLYYAPGTAAMAPHAALEEIGADYKLVPTEVAKDKPRDPALLELNPNGWVPVLIDENGPIHESAAIMMYLAERHPEAGLAPSSGDPTRGRYLQWLVYMADTLQIAYQMHYYPERHSTDPDDVPCVQAKAAERLARVWGYIDAALDPSRKPGGRRSTPWSSSATTSRRMSMKFATMPANSASWACPPSSSTKAASRMPRARFVKSPG